MIPILPAGLGRDVRGATIVEFAFILVPLIIVTVGFFDLGYQSYVRSRLQGSLNEIARVASVENPRLGDTSSSLESRIETALRDRMAVLVRNGEYDVQISSYYDFNAVGRPELLITDENGNGRYDAGDCWQDSNPNGSYDLDSGRAGTGGADDVVFHQVTLTMPRLFPIGGLIGVPNHYVIDARTAVRSQPYANQRQPEVRC